MATFGPIASITASVRISQGNSAELVRRYEADQRAIEAKVEAEKQKASQEARRVYCGVFSTQIDALSDPSTETGERARQGWIDLYKLAECQPPRK
jgi:hypothetical protein